MKVPEAALRWILNHSALDGSRGDSVILGASKVEQVHNSYIHVFRCRKMRHKNNLDNNLQ